MAIVIISGAIRGIAAATITALYGTYMLGYTRTAGCIFLLAGVVCLLLGIGSQTGGVEYRDK
jgi:hypothetical protein